jgi:hypothetical protein
MKLVLSLAITTLLLLGGCAPKVEPAAPGEDSAFTPCPAERPQMCTREYLPVCASRDTGIRCVTTPCPSVEWKTYGNACDACSDPKVTGHRPGACETEGAQENAAD